MNLTREQFAEIWTIGRECWILSRGDAKRAMALSKERVEKKYGSLIGALQLIAIIMQILYLLYKFWTEANVKIPSRSMNDEVFGMLVMSGYGVADVSEVAY